MSELQDMLRVQARLHKKQGANALGDLFENALNEIELLKKTYNQLFDAVQSEREQLAKANERVSELESKLEAVTQEARIQACELDTQKGIVQSVQDKFNLRVYDFNISKALDIALNKFAIDKKVEAINEALDYYEELKASEEPIGAGSILHVCLGRLISQQKQLRKEKGND